MLRMGLFDCASAVISTVLLLFFFFCEAFTKHSLCHRQWLRMSEQILWEIVFVLEFNHGKQEHLGSGGPQLHVRRFVVSTVLVCQYAFALIRLQNYTTSCEPVTSPGVFLQSEEPLWPQQIVLNPTEDQSTIKYRINYTVTKTMKNTLQLTIPNV